MIYSSEQLFSVLYALLRLDHFPNFIDAILNKVNLQKDTLQDVVRVVINNTLGVKVYFYTLLIWVCMYLYFWCIVASLQVPVTPVHLFWVYILVFPVNLLPIKGVANIGTFEAAWFLSLTLLGFSDSLAADIAFGSHAVQLLIVIFVGMLVAIKYWCFPILMSKKK